MKTLRLIALACSAALAATAGLTFHRVFGWGPIIGVVLGSVALAVLVAWLVGDVLRQRMATSALASVVVFAAFTSLTQFRTLSADSLRHVVDGLVNGWANTLTATIPTAPTGVRVTFVIALAWLAAGTGAELTLRTRGPVLALLPSTLVFGVAVAFGTGGPGDASGEGVVFVALAAAYILVRRTVADLDGLDSGPQLLRAIRRRLVTATPIVIAIIAGGIALVAIVPVTKGREAYDPHRDAPQPRRPLTAVNPLDEVSGVQRNAATSEDPVVFEAVVHSSSKAALAAPWRVAILDSYDGTAWTDSSV